MFSEVTTILHLQELLSGDKVAFNIIELKSTLESPPGNIPVVVFKAVRELGAQIKSLIVSDNKVVSNIKKL